MSKRRKKRTSRSRDSVLMNRSRRRLINVGITTIDFRRIRKKSIQNYIKTKIASRSILNRKRLLLINKNKEKQKDKRNYLHIYRNMPDCRSERERVRRAFFAYKATGRGKRNIKHKDRLTKKECR
jgi:hypothetical protein